MGPLLFAVYDQLLGSVIPQIGTRYYVYVGELFVSGPISELQRLVTPTEDIVKPVKEGTKTNKLKLKEDESWCDY